MELLLLNKVNNISVLIYNHLESHTTNDGKIIVKHYYLSQRITYKWIKAYIACKSVGMRLAFIQTDGERDNLAALGRNSKLFRRKVFVDGYNLTITEDSSYTENDGKTCYSIRKESIGKLETRSERCNDKAHKFLCEDVEVADDTYKDTNESDIFVDVKSTFFTYVDDFGKIVVPFQKYSHRKLIHLS